MTIDTFSLISNLLFIMMIMGLIMPAVIIYFYSAFKNHWALVLCALAVSAIAFSAGEYAIILLPLVLSVVFSGLVGSLLRKTNENFWNSMGYMIMAQMGGAIIGIIVIYFFYGMQDIAGLISESLRNALSSIPADDEMGALTLNTMTWALMMATRGVQVAFSDVAAMSAVEKLDYIIPLMRQGIAGALPSAILNYGIIGGVWAWFLSAVMIRARARNKKELKGIKEYMPHPPFSEWKLPRWLTNVLMVILLAALLLSFAAEGTLLNVASVLQSVAIVVIGIKGLAVVNWWLKKKNVPLALNVLICIAAVIFLNFVLPWLGVFDIVFSLRLSREQKKEIRERMDEIKKQVDEQMRKLEEEKKKEEAEKKESEQKENDEPGNNDDNKQDESEGNK